MAVKAFLANVTGKVQGVFFRAYTKGKAESLNLKGYVKNLPDGSVEVYAEGDEEALKKLINFLKIGSPYSVVNNVSIQYLEPENKYEDFRIIY